MGQQINVTDGWSTDPDAKDRWSSKVGMMFAAGCVLLIPWLNWGLQAYSNAASFVPALTSTVQKDLDPQPGNRILDIGCGDGVLTANLAQQCREVLGLDSSASMIKTARETVSAKHANAKFSVADCRRLTIATPDSPVDGSNAHILEAASFDRVFSNAAMHWILRDKTTRVPFFADVFSVLKPGGTFVFELGGAGNIAEVHTALIAVLHLKHNLSIEQIRATDPWFFPSEKWMLTTLEGAGFVVEKLELEYRPTKCTDHSNDGSSGLEGWVRLMGSTFLDLISDKAERDQAVGEIVTVLESAETRVEDGSQWLGYVRLRAIARKPKT